jgi:hypothetical protein
VGRACETTDLRNLRRGSQRQHETAGADLQVVCRDGAGIDEARRGAEHAHAKRGKPCIGVIAREVGDQLLDPFARETEFDLRFRGVDAEAAGGADHMHLSSDGGHRRQDQRAADACFVAARGPVHQHHRYADCSGADGERDAAKIATDHA